MKTIGLDETTKFYHGFPMNRSTKRDILKAALPILEEVWAKFPEMTRENEAGVLYFITYIKSLLTSDENI